MTTKLTLRHPEYSGTKAGTKITKDKMLIMNTFDSKVRVVFRPILKFDYINIVSNMAPIFNIIY